MIPRRVVTAHRSNGKAHALLDGTPPRAKEFEHTPGFASTVVWATPAVPQIPCDGRDPTPVISSLVPGPGETRFLVVSFPPDSVMAAPGFDPAKAGQEHAQESPGLVDHFEMDNPGMHTTPTVDYGVVLDGEIWLELDDGEVVHLRQHDVVVQNGTRHAWRNRGSRPATLAFMLIGARTGG